MGIRRSIGIVCGAAAKHLAAGQELSVDLQPDYGFIRHGGFQYSMDEARVSIHIATQSGSLSVSSPGILSVCIMNVSGMHISDTSYVLSRTVIPALRNASWVTSLSPVAIPPAAFAVFHRPGEPLM